MDQDRSKNHLRGGYNSFLKSPSGLDLLQQAEMLEKAIVLEAVQGKSVEAKALSIAKLEGLIKLRDYMIRMSKDMPKK